MMPHFRRGRLHTLRLAALVLACGALAAACSGGDDGGSAAPADIVRAHCDIRRGCRSRGAEL